MFRDSLRGNTMHKNFSVEWLSQSFHAQQLQKGGLDSVNSHNPCVTPGVPHSDSFRDAPKASPQIVDLVREGDCVKGEKVPSSPANSCDYTSASESDVGDDSEGESGPQRRVRTKFTSDQISRLEKTFNKHKYLGATQRRKIAEKLHLSETQVKTWFQNRRMKLKREVQDMRTAECFLPTLLATSFQHHTINGQRLPHYYLHQPLQPLQPMLFASCYL